MYFRISTLAGLIINNYGWWTMVTGQSVVLYSRLGIVLGKGSDRVLRAVKWMIIVDAILFHVSTTVVVFGANYATWTDRQYFSRAYTYIEKIQMTGFCIQEFIISGLYLWKTLDILKIQSQTDVPSVLTSEQRGRKPVMRVMLQLFAINVRQDPLRTQVRGLNRSTLSPSA